MSRQPGCGVPIPALNPPELDPCKPCGCSSSYPAPVTLPGDPWRIFRQRLLTSSSSAWQGVSLRSEPPASIGWNVSDSPASCSESRVLAVCGSEEMNRAAREIGNAIARAMYPLPGLWVGPVYLHMPSGNVVLQLSVAPGGPYDAIPVFTYNSQAFKYNAGRGYGISDLFNTSVRGSGSGANIVDGTGRSLEYSGVGIETWGTAPASTRNGLKMGNDGNWVERQPDGLQWIYDPGGTLQKVVSPSGDIWTITRNVDRLVSSIAGPGGRTTSIAGTGGTFVVTQPGSLVTTFTLDSSKNLTTVTYPDGSQIQLGYGGHRLTSISDRSGNVTAIAYDAADRVIEIDISGDAYTYNYLHNIGGNHLIKAVDPAGNVTTAIHDYSVVRAVIDPFNNRTTFLWESSGDSRLKTIIDPQSNRMTLSYASLYDGTRALSSIERPVVGSIDFAYGSNGRARKLTDHNGNVATLTWDAAENCTQVQDAAGHTHQYRYNSHRQQTVAIDPLGFRATTVYRAVGNATAQIDSTGARTTYSYDTAGHVTAVENPSAQTTQYTRDSLGRITHITNPLTFTQRYSYTLDSASSPLCECRRQPDYVHLYRQAPTAFDDRPAQS